MGIDEIIGDKREAVMELAERHGARNLRVFGSVARGGAGSDSDLDLLVEMDDDRSLLDLIALGQDLEELLGRPVDVITDRSVSRHLRGEIFGEAIAL